MESEEKQSLPKRLAAGALKLLLVAALAAYMLYHLTGGFSAQLQTMPAVEDTVAITLPLVGSVFRDEQVIFGAGDAAIGYPLSDGEKIAVGEKAATLYRTSDKTSVPRLVQIDASLDLLTGADVEDAARISYGVSARETVKSELARLSDARARGQIAALCAEESTLLSAMLRRDVILGGARGVDDLIASLESERASLAAKLSGGSVGVTAPVSGYLYHRTDGYENAVDFAAVPSLTPSGYRAAMESGAETGDAVCKIVKNPLWYFAGVCKKEETYDLAVGQTYTLTFGESEIPMTLCAKNEENGEVLLVFGSRLMQNGYFELRTRRANIVTARLTGYKILASALRMLDGEIGVYVRSGSEIEYRVCEVLCEEDGYVWLKTDTEGKTLFSGDDDEENDLYCKGICRYDNVVTLGAVDLSPQKIIN